MYAEKLDKNIDYQLNYEKKMVTGIDLQLTQRLQVVCPDGFIRYNGEWFNGTCTIIEKLHCNECDYPGCEFL